MFFKRTDSAHSILELTYAVCVPLFNQQFTYGNRERKKGFLSMTFCAGQEAQLIAIINMEEEFCKRHH